MTENCGWPIPKVRRASMSPTSTATADGNSVEETGFRRVAQVAIDNDWSALRFRNAKYVGTGK